MKIIGLTGGIGTGKSTILKLLEKEYGAYIVETDKLAHQLMEPGQNAYEQIVEVFGKQILDEKSYIDRGKLGSIVFSEKKALLALNQIVHPAVKEYILQDISKKRTEDRITYYVIEAALLIEDGYKDICDELWYVYVEKEERIKRLLAGRGGTREKWEQIIHNQAAEEFYRSNCDVVIDNGQNIEKIANIVNDLLFSTR